VPEAPPPPDVNPVPGSGSKRVQFEFAGTRYSIVGFRSGRSICTALTTVGSDRGKAPGSGSCLSERLLRLGLEDSHIRIFAGGGGKLTFTVGFARADVAALSPIGSTGKSRVVISQPWSPEPWRGEPIRFFYLVSDGLPSGRTLSADLRLRARLTNGQLVQVAP
jgi:hypothetical protein